MKAASRAYLRHHSYVCYAAVHSFDVVVHMIKNLAVWIAVGFL
jgi:hypothetical protein